MTGHRMRYCAVACLFCFNGYAGLGEPASEGAGYCNRGDHQEDGHQHRNRIAGTIKTSAGNIGDVCHQGATGAEQVKVPVKTSTIEH